MMGDDWSWKGPAYFKKVERVKRAVYAHYIARGCPDTKLSLMWERWLRTKGLRAPILQSR